MSIPRKRKNTGKVTIADVAKKAGVGTMTVSRTLRTPERVSQSLQDKIHQAIDELGYVPNKAAGLLASAQSNTIALVFPSLTDSLCLQFLPAFQPLMTQNGYQLLLGYCDFSLQQEERLLTTFLENRPAGVVLFGSEHTQRTHQLLRALNVPVVEIADAEMASQNSAPHYPAICVDHFALGKACTDHLIRCGYTNIGFIGARGEHQAMQQKLHGWQSALVSHYLAPDHFLTTPQAPSVQLGEQGLAKLLLRDASLDALVCSHEEIALGVLFECQRRLLSIPKDMGIMCLDGAALCRHSYPGISHAEINYPLMGKLAATTLLAQLQNASVAPLTQIDYRLSIHASSAGR